MIERYKSILHQFFCQLPIPGFVQGNCEQLKAVPLIKSSKGISIAILPELNELNVCKAILWFDKFDIWLRLM